MKKMKRLLALVLALAMALSMAVTTSFAADMTQAEIVEAAYALGANESLPYEATLTGVITNVDTAYSETFGNVTVTMVVGDLTDKPIQCYRMKGDGANVIGIGDTITVTGYLTNYTNEDYGISNKIEFASGCTLDSYVIDPEDEDDEESEVTINGTLLATFEFEDGTTGDWVDGDPMTEDTDSYTSGDYTVTFTDYSKIYVGGNDPANNGFIKFGTSSKVGTVTFTVPENVETVVLHLAKYKTYGSTYSVNGGEGVALTKNGTDGEYDAVVVDTTVTKTITLSTVSGGVRMVMSGIQYYGTETGAAPEETADTLVLGTNEVSVSAGLNPGNWAYTATEKGKLTITVVAASIEADDYENPGQTVTNDIPEEDLPFVVARTGFTVNGENVWSTSTTVSVEANESVAVSLGAINMNATNYTLKLTFDPANLKDGDNTIMIGAADLANQYTYTATQTGTLYFTVTAFNYTSQWGTTDMSDYLASYFDPMDNVWVELDVNGTALANNYYGSVDVTAGEVVNVEWKIITENEYVVAWEMGATLNLNYEGYDIPAPGSAEAPIELDTNNWNLEFPVDSVEIAAGQSAHYQLLNFSGYNFTVTGENVAVKVAYESLVGTTYVTYEAVDGVVTVPGHTWMFPVEIINNGTEAATYKLDYAASELTDGSIVLDTSAYGGGAYYTWTADCDGKLTIKVDTEKTGEIWMVNVYSDDYSVYQGINSFALASGGATEVVVDVTKGIVLTVQIMDPYTSGIVAVDVSTAYNHVWDDGVVTTNPGCETEGVKTYVCSVCEGNKTESVPATGHTVVTDAAVAPTCTENGLTEGSHCSVCNKVLVAQTVVPANGHTEVVVPGVAATCTENGLTEGKYCSVCNVVLATQEVISAGHTVAVDAAVAATCTTPGCTEGSHCSICNEIIVAQEVVAATGHNYGSNGKCTVCGKLNPDSPKTGDTAPIAVMATLTVMAAGAFIVLTKKRRA